MPFVCRATRTLCSYEAVVVKKGNIPNLICSATVSIYTYRTIGSGLYGGCRRPAHAATPNMLRHQAVKHAAARAFTQPPIIAPLRLAHTALPPARASYACCQTCASSLTTPQRTATHTQPLCCPPQHPSGACRTYCEAAKHRFACLWDATTRPARGSHPLRLQSPCPTATQVLPYVLLVR